MSIIFKSCSFKVAPVAVKSQIKSDKPEVLEQIESSGKLDENLEKLLAQTIEEYKKGNK